MEKISASSMLLFLYILVISFSWAATSSIANERLLQCLALPSGPAIPVYTPNNSSYNSLLQSKIQNVRFASSGTPKPQLIITPIHESHVQTAVTCCRKHGFQMRIRSGGHDYEGLSYSTYNDIVPFVVLDLFNLQTINVDAEDGTAWVQAGATLAQVYYKIADESSTYGFPAGICPTLGVGGHFSGGGYGTLMRKYGLSADNIVDARIVNVDGKILNKDSMGEELFWAIRGGGGASFGIVLSWKIKLVPVPPTVTVFRIQRTLEEGATALVHKWQYTIHKLPKDLTIIGVVSKVNAKEAGKKTIQVSFSSLFLGLTKQLLPIMEQSFPELGLKPEDCTEISWRQSVPFFAEMPVNSSLSNLAINQQKMAFKAKLDYVKEPIPEIVFKEIWKMFLEVDVPGITLIPYGGRMSEIPDSEIPFPHRAGNIFHIAYFVFLNQKEGTAASKKNMDWIRRLYSYMKPYVSKSPRGAYLNYRDLDLGYTKNGSATYAEAKVWGSKYFKNNFDRLVQVKSKVDPDNFFRNEQSIPPVPSLAEGKKN